MKTANLDDFVSLTCPACGGRLTVPPGAASVVCEYCGNEHLVRRRAAAVLLESYARCPRCGRNDKAAKVTAILASHTQNVTVTERTVETHVDSQGKRQTRTTEAPVVRAQVSDLATRLRPPDRPAPVRDSAMGRYGTLAVGLFLALFGVVAGIPGFLCILSGTASGASEGEQVLSWAFCGLPLIATLAAGALLIYLGAKRLASTREEQRIALAASRAANARAEREWQQAMQRWQSLYYCSRDDCVFIPDEGTCAPLPHMVDYLYQR
jgi:predicted RNA-binding Zn-ribbon protein involved in translation (DUF1610 family)